MAVQTIIVRHYGFAKVVSDDVGPVIVIGFQDPWTECHICGEPTPVGWGVPVWNGFVVANDWPGEWGGVPACQSCHDRHALGEFVEVPTSDYRPGIDDDPAKED